MRGAPIASIQLLRGIAAFMVVFTHLFPVKFEAGQGGVDIFFVISGFIMVVTTFDEFGSREAAGHFFLRRLLRIVPLYFVATGLVLVLLYAGAPTVSGLAYGIDTTVPSWQEVAANFLFIPFTNAARDNQPLLPVGWSLNIEMMFYVLFTFALLLPRRFGLIAISATLVLLVLLRGKLGLPFAADYYYSNPILINFIFGMAIGYAYRRGLRLPAAAGAILAGLAVANLFNVFANGTYGLPVRVAVGVSGACAVGACAFSFSQTSFGYLKYPFLWIGDWSYAIYLTHLFTIRLCWNRGYSVPVTVVMILIVSALCYWLIERPSHRVGAKLLRIGHRNRLAAATAPRIDAARRTNLLSPSSFMPDANVTNREQA